MHVLIGWKEAHLPNEEDREVNLALFTSYDKARVYERASRLSTWSECCGSGQCEKQYRKSSLLRGYCKGWVEYYANDPLPIDPEPHGKVEISVLTPIGNGDYLTPMSRRRRITRAVQEILQSNIGHAFAQKELASMVKEKTSLHVGVFDIREAAWSLIDTDPSQFEFVSDGNIQGKKQR